MLSLLGEGGYGKVLLVRKLDTLKVYAMKVIDKSKIGSAKVPSPRSPPNSLARELLLLLFFVGARLRFLTLTHLLALDHHDYVHV